MDWNDYWEWTIDLWLTATSEAGSGGAGYATECNCFQY